ncbi:MAG: DUF1573 domain-containing protein [Planctomycetes bacterium]|nr:DUF1573 domain-containing protein [Planctomycetota bacterium]
MQPATRILSCLAIAGLASFAAAALNADTTPAATPAAAAPSASLTFSPATLDLGEMIAGQPKTAPLTITNAGDAPITIASLKGGCGCTTITGTPTDVIAPGASFTVQVTVDPGMKTGLELKKPVHVVLADGRAQSMQVVGRVKTVVKVSPDAIELSAPVDAKAPTVTLSRMDGAAFKVTGATPAGVIAMPTSDKPAKSFELRVDTKAWEKAGRPTAITLTTDQADAPKVAVSIKASEAVTMFRLPAPEGEGDRTAIEASQDALIQRIDAGLASAERSSQFEMRLHRETGMLFVHGSEDDLDAVRAAVRALPASSGVRESKPAPGT